MFVHSLYIIICGFFENNSKTNQYRVVIDSLSTILSTLHHFALTLQSFGVQCRHLGSILICLFSIAVECCSIISL